MGEGNGVSIGEALSLMDRNRTYDGDGMFGGSGSWVFFLFFLLAWGNGGFLGNRGMSNAVDGALTRADMMNEFNYNTLDRRTESIINGQCAGFNTSQRDMCTGFNNIASLIQQARFDSRDCCCETNRNIDAVRYENQRNASDIMQNNDRNTQRIIDQMTANQMQSLRDELQTAKMQLSQQAQTANLVSELRPCAKPAYITCSPYEARGYYDDGFYGRRYNPRCNDCGC